MSLAGGANDAVDQAVRNSADSGVFYAIAAGNNGGNACNTSPARAGTHNGVLTVAATDINDNEAGFSNFGPCVDVWAPGVNVLSTTLGGGTGNSSGTSMASPHGAGAGAVYLWKNPNATAAAVEAAIKADRVKPGTKSKDGADIQLLNIENF
jgi:subtilisin family serine protease